MQWSYPLFANIVFKTAIRLCRCRITGLPVSSITGFPVLPISVFETVVIVRAHGIPIMAIQALCVVMRRRVFVSDVVVVPPLLVLPVHLRVPYMHLKPHRVLVSQRLFCVGQRFIFRRLSLVSWILVCVWGRGAGEPFFRPSRSVSWNGQMMRCTWKWSLVSSWVWYSDEWVGCVWMHHFDFILIFLRRDWIRTLNMENWLYFFWWCVRKYMMMIISRWGVHACPVSFFIRKACLYTHHIAIILTSKWGAPECMLLASSDLFSSSSEDAPDKEFGTLRSAGTDIPLLLFAACTYVCVYAHVCVCVSVCVCGVVKRFIEISTSSVLVQIFRCCCSPYVRMWVCVYTCLHVQVNKFPRKNCPKKTHTFCLCTVCT